MLARVLGALKSGQVAPKAKHVVVYSQPGCVPCRMAKEVLRQKGVAFEEHDIRQDADALMRVSQLGASSTPVIVIDDAVVFGFDRSRIEAVLA